MRQYYNVRVAVYIMFEKDGKILLSKRCNTGYKDGYYGFVQGHVEEGETPTEAAIKEAREEAGVIIRSEDLKFGLVCHNRVDTHYIDFFFVCNKWEGEIKNMETNKCEELIWCDEDNLPDNVIFQIKEYISAYRNGYKILEFPLKK